MDRLENEVRAWLDGYQDSVERGWDMSDDHNDAAKLIARCLDAIAEKDKKIEGLIKGQQILVELHSKLSEKVIGYPMIKWVGFGKPITPKEED